MDYTSKYEPTSIEEFALTTLAVEAIKKSVTNKDFNKFYVFAGEPGLGKTTLAKMMAKIANCQRPHDKHMPCNECENCKMIDDNPEDALTVINASNHRGINEIRDLFKEINTPKMMDLIHVYVLDEGEQITTDGSKAMKTELDNMSDNNIIVITTNYVKKLSKPIRERAELYEFHPINYHDASAIINRINDKELLGINKKDYNKFIESSSGKNPRMLIKMLQQYDKIGEEVFNKTTIGELNENDPLYVYVIKPLLYYKLERKHNKDIITNFKFIMEKTTAETIRIMLLRYFHNAMLNLDKYFTDQTKLSIFVHKYNKIFEIMRKPLDYGAPEADILYRLLHIK